MSSKPKLNLVKKDRKSFWSRMDGITNFLTNLGVLNKDKLQSAFYQRRFLTQTEVENQYQSDDISARIVDLLPDEMMREGFDIVIPEDSEDVSSQLKQRYEFFDLDSKIHNCLRWARLYGGCILLIGADTANPQLPLEFERL